MKRSYHGTLLRPNLAEATVILEFFEGVKYAETEEERGEPNEVIVKDLTAWDIIEGGEEAEEVENLTGEIDENHEYLILHFKGGCVNIYRNSHVAMFII